MFKELSEKISDSELQVSNLKFSSILKFKTEILAASIRSLDHVRQVMQIGADVITIPPKIFGDLYRHELTDKGLESFLSDWKKSGKQIS